MELTASILITLGAVMGVLLTVLTLPGTWIAVMIASACVLWRPDSMHWGYLLAGVGLCVLGELVEFLASAAGATKAGGTKAGAIGSIAGGLLGAIFGTVLLPIPIIGTIAGAAIGAGIGAIVGERGHSKRSWNESVRVGQGAAVGRLVSVVIKSAVAGVLGVVLVIGAWV